MRGEAMRGEAVPRQVPAVSSALATGEALFERVLGAGRDLLAHDPELFKTAVAKLTALVPREGSPVRRAPGADQKGKPVNGGARRGATSFRKYDLPDNKSQFEYYQCSECQERRPTNSFHADHQHGANKLDIRWFCPLCDCLFAVTHRSYHIKCRHLGKGRDASSRGASAGGEAPSKRRRSDTSSDSDVTSDGKEELDTPVVVAPVPAPDVAPVTAVPAVPVAAVAAASVAEAARAGPGTAVKLEDAHGVYAMHGPEHEHDNEDDSLSDAAVPTLASLKTVSSSAAIGSVAIGMYATPSQQALLPTLSQQALLQQGVVLPPAGATTTAPVTTTVTAEALVAPPLAPANPLAASGQYSSGSAYLFTDEFAGTAARM